MNDLNEIDCCFSTLNENKSIDLVLHDSDKFKGKKKKKKRHFNFHHKIHQRL